MKKYVLIVGLIIWIGLSSGLFATDVWSLTFESAGGYTTSITEFTDGSYDYFTRTDGTNVGLGVGITNMQGSYCFAAQDIDGTGAILPVTLTIDDVDISGYTGLNFSIYLAEDDDGSNQDWDAADYVHIDYDIDNSGSFSNLIHIESSGGTNTEPSIDTNFDGVGNGTAITSTFTQFSNSISGTGNTIDIKVTFFLNSEDEDIALDNLLITSGVADPGDVIGSEVTSTSNGFTWTLNGNSNPVMIVYKMSNDIGTPTNGVAYSVDENMDGDGATVIYAGGGTSYTHSSLTPNTPYYYKIFSVDGSNNYSSGVSGPITTLKAEPSNHATSFNVSEVTYSSMTLTWSDNDGTYAADEFLIILEASSALSPSDGNFYSDDLTDINDDNKWYANISHGTQTVTFTGLTSETTYYAKIWPISNTDEESDKYDYKTDGTVPTANATTSSAPVAPTAGVVYISEVSDAVSDYNAEFIELYNNSSDIIDLSNSKIIMYPSSGGSSELVYDFISDGTGDIQIPANGLLVIARGATISEFEIEWGTYPSSANFNEGTGSLYFGTGRQWALKDGGTSNTDDGTLIDATNQDVANGNRHYQDPVGTWNSDVRTNATPGELEGNQDSSLPVELDGFNAIPGNSKVTLCWTTESETENLGFNLYRGVDRKSFIVISDQLIQGHGSTSEKHEYSYVDKDVVNGVTYYYKIEDVDYSGTAKMHDIIATATPSGKEESTLAEGFRLQPCFPNPFNPETTLRFELGEAADVSVQVYDVLGNLVTTLSNSAYQPGGYRLSWNGRDSHNRLSATGIYFLQISSSIGFNSTQKVIFLR